MITTHLTANIFKFSNALSDSTGKISVESLSNYLISKGVVKHSDISSDALIESLQLLQKSGLARVVVYEENGIWIYKSVYGTSILEGCSSEQICQYLEGARRNVLTEGFIEPGYTEADARYFGKEVGVLVYNGDKGHDRLGRVDKMVMRRLGLDSPYGENQELIAAWNDGYNVAQQEYKAITNDVPHPIEKLPEPVKKTAGELWAESFGLSDTDLILEHSQNFFGEGITDKIMATAKFFNNNATSQPSTGLGVARAMLSSNPLKSLGAVTSKYINEWKRSPFYTIDKGSPEFAKALKPEVISIMDAAGYKHIDLSELDNADKAVFSLETNRDSRLSGGHKTAGELGMMLFELKEHKPGVNDNPEENTSEKNASEENQDDSENNGGQNLPKSIEDRSVKGIEDKSTKELGFNQSKELANAFEKLSGEEQQKLLGKEDQPAEEFDSNIKSQTMSLYTGAKDYNSNLQALNAQVDIVKSTISEFNTKIETIKSDFKAKNEEYKEKKDQSIKKPDYPVALYVKLVKEFYKTVNEELSSLVEHINSVKDSHDSLVNEITDYDYLFAENPGKLKAVKKYFDEAFKKANSEVDVQKLKDNIDSLFDKHGKIADMIMMSMSNSTAPRNKIFEKLSSYRDRWISATNVIPALVFEAISDARVQYYNDAKRRKPTRSKPLQIESFSFSSLVAEAEGFDINAFKRSNMAPYVGIVFYIVARHAIPQKAASPVYFHCLAVPIYPPITPGKALDSSGKILYTSSEPVFLGAKSIQGGVVKDVSHNNEHFVNDVGTKNHVLTKLKGWVESQTKDIAQPVVRHDNHEFEQFVSRHPIFVRNKAPNGMIEYTLNVTRDNYKKALSDAALLMNAYKTYWKPAGEIIGPFKITINGNPQMNPSNKTGYFDVDEIYNFIKSHDHVVFETVKSAKDFNKKSAPPKEADVDDNEPVIEYD